MAESLPAMRDQVGRLQQRAAALSAQHRLAEGEDLYRRAAAILLDLPTGGPDDVERIRCARGLAANLWEQDRAEEAGAVLAAAMAMAEILLAPDDADTLLTMTSLAQLREHQGQPEEADLLYRQAVARVHAAGE